MKNKPDNSKKLSKKQPQEETLEEEIKEAIEEEKEHIEEGKKIAEQQEAVNKIQQGPLSYQKKEISSQVPSYQPQQPSTATDYIQEKSSQDFIENQEFYVKNEADFDRITNTMQEVKAQEPGMSRVDDSDLWEIEPETKKLKIRKMPRNILDMLKQKQIVLDYYKIL